jgi:hypothetical protein
MTRLRIYTSKDFMPEGRSHTVMLYPFWGLPGTERKDPDQGRFAEYITKGKEFFDMVSEPAQADFFLLPFEFSFDENAMGTALSFGKLAESYNKKVIVFFNSDYEEKIPIPNAVVFRTTFFRSKRDANEFAVPGWSLDFIKEIKNADWPRKKTSTPVVGYCGYVDYIDWKEQLNLRKLFRKFFRRNRVLSMHEKGSGVRGAAVRNILKDSRIKSNFIIRNGFWAAGMDQQTARDQYISNMISSDYGIAARGAGNYSYRLYELLSCGKIPVFIDTDCVLPFMDKVDWKKYVLWLDEKEVGSIAEKIISFHNSLSEAEFEQRQLDCRKFYDEYISPVAFFSNMHKCLQ